MNYRDFVQNIEISPAIVAHRGAWYETPENSLAAIETAIRAGHEIVEIDVQKSADGTFFLLHDLPLTRMTGNLAPAQSLSIAELKKLSLRNRDGGKENAHTDHRIPTLADALDLAKGKVFLDLDVKFFEHLGDVAKLVANMGMSDQADIKIKVHDPDQAAYLRELELQHGMMVMPMTRFENNNADQRLGLLKSIGCNVVETKFDTLDTIASRADLFRAAGIAIWINTLDTVACEGFTDSAAIDDPEAIWGCLRDAGVSIIQTDEPKALASWRVEDQVKATSNLRSEAINALR